MNQKPGGGCRRGVRAPQVYPKSAPPYAYRWAWEQIAGSTDFRAIT